MRASGPPQDEAQRLLEGRGRLGHHPLHHPAQRRIQIRQRVGSPGDHHPIVAVAHQHDFPQILVLQHRDDVLHVHVQIDLSAHRVRAFTKPSQGLA
jgi:hypothetical protein